MTKWMVWRVCFLTIIWHKKKAAGVVEVCLYLGFLKSIAIIPVIIDNIYFVAENMTPYYYQ